MCYRRGEHRLQQRGKAHTPQEHGSRDFVSIDEREGRYEGRDSVRVFRGTAISFQAKSWTVDARAAVACFRKAMDVRYNTSART